VVAAIRAPGLSWSGAARLADAAARRPLTARATFRIASVTKTFTGAAVLRLVEDGRLSVEDPIARHLSPESVALLREGGYDVDAMRVRHLLQHTSGLYDFAEDPAYQEFVIGHPRHHWTRAEQVRWAMTHGRPLFAPGTAETYTDTGYVLLGEMLERITGGGLASAYRGLLGFERLGLDETYLETLKPSPLGLAPRAHQYLGTFDSTGHDPSFDLYGGGGLVSTVDDLVRFYSALLRGRVLHRTETLRMMLGEAEPTQVNELGMGIFALPIGAETCWWHNGFWGINVVHCPQSRVTIASMVNQAQDFIEPTLALQARLHRIVTRGR
jgi:D-alanyl-D-alanine carboxypeptidase